MGILTDLLTALNGSTRFRPSIKPNPIQPISKPARLAALEHGHRPALWIAPSYCWGKPIQKLRERIANTPPVDHLRYFLFPLSSMFLRKIFNYSGSKTT